MRSSLNCCLGDSLLMSGGHFLFALYGLTYSSPDGSVGGEEAALRLEEVKERHTTPAVGCLRFEKARKDDKEGNCCVADA